MSAIVFVVAGAVGVAAGVVVFAFWRFRGQRPGLPLFGTVLLAFGLLALVAGWLLGEPNPNRGEALKTGGLAAGSVVALYALWLNDRRRRVEESKQELESARAAHDRERAADERFGKAVELLGDDADQVRVGAMHALAGVARNRPDYTQTVIDVLCAYLRRPFEMDEKDAEHRREHVVRLTAQRLISTLLTPADGDGPAYDLDLTGARLEYFDIAGTKVARLALRYASLEQSNAIRNCVIEGNVWLTGARNIGILHMHDTLIKGKAWFSGFTSTGPVNLERTRVLGETKFRGARFTDGLLLDGSEIDTSDLVR